MTGEVAMREVQSRDVQARTNQSPQTFRCFRSWTDRCDNLGFVLGEQHQIFSLSRSADCYLQSAWMRAIPSFFRVKGRSNARKRWPPLTGVAISMLLSLLAFCV